MLLRNWSVSPIPMAVDVWRAGGSDDVDGRDFELEGLRGDGRLSEPRRACDGTQLSVAGRDGAFAERWTARQ